MALLQIGGFVVVLALSLWATFVLPYYAALRFEKRADPEDASNAEQVAGTKASWLSAIVFASCSAVIYCVGFFAAAILLNDNISLSGLGFAALWVSMIAVVSAAVL